MIMHPDKVEDIKFRTVVLQDIKYFLSTNRVELAKIMGEVSVKLKKKIDTYVYKD